MSHMIELHNVSKFYSNKDTVSTGFSKVDLNLDMGEFVVITGESGSGKSTLLSFPDWTAMKRGNFSSRERIPAATERKITNGTGRNTSEIFSRTLTW